MARVTHVKKAQQRYATVPMIDPETGEQKVTPVMRRDGTQKVTKRGKPVVMRVTRIDKSQPLPNRTCERCSAEIKPGDPYKHVSPKSGPYGGRTRVRCAACPTWQPWDLSSALWARLAQIAHDFGTTLEEVESEDEVTSALEDAANEVREIAEEKREGAQNIEDGFGHPTSQSEELNEVADELDSWADEIEQVSLPDFPEPEEEDCGECLGSGEVEEECPDCEGTGEDDATDEDEEVEDCEECSGSGEITESCDECDGTGTIEGDEVTEEQVDEWRDAVLDACSIVDESPV